MPQFRLALLFSLSAVCFLFTGPVSAQATQLAGLDAPVTVYEDADGIPTVVAGSEMDAAFLQGYLHARDRFFQMDFNRRAASGRLAELLGQAALSNDVQLRTLGLRRAALATFRAMDADMRAWLQAYANGVNAWLADNDLPPEYTVLELSSAERWSPVDSVAVGKLLAFQLSFDLDIDFTITLGTYQAVGNAAGFDGTALFFEDTHRSQSPDDRVTVPGFLNSIGGVGGAPAASGDGGKSRTAALPGSELRPQVSRTTLQLARSLRDKVAAVPLLGDALEDRIARGGSNWWVLSGDQTESGFPMLLNDPHLGLNQPAIFYEMQLVVAGDFAVNGVTFAGAPGVVQGCNTFLCWGSTVHPMDVSDVFQEEFRTNTFGLPTETIHDGEGEPLRLVFQSYFVNQVGDGEADNMSRAPIGYESGAITFVVPRRNNGPVLQVDGNQGLSVQYTGWGPTFELQAFREINRAASLADFEDALQKFDVGSQNFAYADVMGNIAYFAGAENPIRADLQAGNVDGGVPPFIIRDGTGALNHEWLPVQNPQPDQALPFEIMPFSEMPQVVNPPSGYIANANNDPIGVVLDNNPLNQLRPGGGIYYLNPGYAAFRMGTIDRVLEDDVAAAQPVSLERLQQLQGSSRMQDAVKLLEVAQESLVVTQWQPVFALQGDPEIQAALDLLFDWQFGGPTGIQEGYDRFDDPDNLPAPDDAEIRASAAATIYAVWRGQMIRNTIDATLTRVGLSNQLPGSRLAMNALVHFLDTFEETAGIGASGLNFFAVDGAPRQSDALDFLLLQSLRDALDLLASDEFAPAFNNSTDPLDYRWGKLHRIVFDHPLNADPFNIPNGGGVTDLGPQLPGVARQGGYEVPDASTHNARADGLNEFMFGSGPARRFWGMMDPAGVSGGQIIPGSNPGNAFDPRYGNQIKRWLTNQYHDFGVGEAFAQSRAVRTLEFEAAGN